MELTLTPDLAYASGWDAGNASMRKAGRTRWNVEDAVVAARTTNRLLLACAPAERQTELAQLLKDNDLL